MQHTSSARYRNPCKGDRKWVSDGALVAREDIEFKKSEHGSTLPGDSACAAALATMMS